MVKQSPTLGMLVSTKTKCIKLIFIGKITLVPVAFLMALSIVYNKFLITASGSQPFGSVVRALVLYWDNPDSIPGTAYFQLSCTWLWLSCCKTISLPTG